MGFFVQGENANIICPGLQVSFKKKCIIIAFPISYSQASRSVLWSSIFYRRDGIDTFFTVFSKFSLPCYQCSLFFVYLFDKLSLRQSLLSFCGQYFPQIHFSIIVFNLRLMKNIALFPTPGCDVTRPQTRKYFLISPCNTYRVIQNLCAPHPER